METCQEEGFENSAHAAAAGHIGCKSHSCHRSKQRLHLYRNVCHFSACWGAWLRD